MKDIEITIQSQYSNSPRLLSLIQGLNSIFDNENNILLFYEKCFNPRTAEGIALDNWGNIVGIERAVEVLESDFFGFQGQNMEGFDNAAFYNENLKNNYEFSDEAYRMLILIKSAINITRHDAKSINSILKQIFSSRNVYVLEIDTMHIRYVFGFELEDYERAIIEKIKLLPRPCGVSFEYYEIFEEETFGFYGSELENFDNGLFAFQDIVQVDI